jgi:hypothetical protein
LLSWNPVGNYYAAGLVFYFEIAIVLGRRNIWCTAALRISLSGKSGTVGNFYVAGLVFYSDIAVVLGRRKICCSAGDKVWVKVFSFWYVNCQAVLISADFTLGHVK